MLTLIGAYCPEGRPLDQRRLTVELHWSGFRLSASVTAEFIANSAPCSPVVTIEGAVVQYRFDFADDTGLCHVLAVRHDLRRPSLRSLTELSGSIARFPDERIGHARLRLNVRP